MSGGVFSSPALIEDTDVLLHGRTLHPARTQSICSAPFSGLGGVYIGSDQAWAVSMHRPTSER